MIGTLQAGGLGRTTRLKGPTYFNQVLHLSGDGVVGSSNFYDASRYRHPSSGVGTCTISSTQKKLGPTSLRHPGTNACLWGDYAEYSLTTVDWWFGTFIYFDAAGTRQLFAGQIASSAANTTCSFLLEKTADNKMRGFCCSGAAVIGDVTGTISLSASTWYWVTYGREGSTFKVYVDAVADGTASSASSINDSASSLAVGGCGDYTSLRLAGYTDETIFEVGQYRGDIAVPTMQFPEW
jgi:hypothetical protein